MKAVRLTIVVLAAGLGTAASAQHGMPPGGAASSPEARQAQGWPRGKQQLGGVNYTPWQKRCFQTSASGKLCRTTISGSSDIGQQIVRVDLIEGDADAGARLQIFVLPGLFMKAGVKASIDGNEPLTLPYIFCFTNFCVAAQPVDGAFISQVRSGQKMTIEVLDSKLISITSDISLDRFDTINRGAPAIEFGTDLEPKN